MTKKHECPGYGEDYDAKAEECAECEDAEACEAATKPWACEAFGEYDSEDPECAECEMAGSCQEEAKPDLPPKKAKDQAMSQCFW